MYPEVKRRRGEKNNCVLHYVVNVMSAGVENSLCAAESVERERNMFIQIAEQAQVLFSLHQQNCLTFYEALQYVLLGHSCLFAPEFVAVLR